MTRRVIVDDRVLGRPGLPDALRQPTRALAEALFSTEQGPPPRERIDWLIDDLSDYLSQSGFRARAAYRACLAGIQTVAPVLAGHAPPFHRLPLEARVEALTRMEESPLGLAVFGAKTMLCLIYFEHPDAAAEIAFDGACLKEAP